MGLGELFFVPERTIKRMYGFSKQSVVDYLKTPQFPKELYYVEFLEFFCRTAYFVFDNDTEGLYQNFELEEKIDGLLAHYCKKLRFTRQFMLLKETESEAVENIIEQVKSANKRIIKQEEEVTQGLQTDSNFEESQSLYTFDAVSQT